MWYLSLSKTSKCLSGRDLYFFHKLSSDAHFSYVSPRHSAFDLPLARRPRTREFGSAPSNRCAATFCEKTSQVNPSGPRFVSCCPACGPTGARRWPWFNPRRSFAWHRAGFRLSKYMVRCHKPPSQTWRTFLENHLTQMVSIDFFTVPTIRFQVLYVFLVLAHDRRRILHFNVTAHPTAEWTGQQLREAFPFDQLPRYLLRDRDAIFGLDFREQVRDMGIHEVLSTPRSPWQRAYVERVIGSIRRECLDHLIVLDETSLRRILISYFDYYHRSRTHLSLGRLKEPESIALGRLCSAFEICRRTTLLCTRVHPRVSFIRLEQVGKLLELRGWPWGMTSATRRTGFSLGTVQHLTHPSPSLQLESGIGYEIAARRTYPRCN